MKHKDDCVTLLAERCVPILRHHVCSVKVIKWTPMWVSGNFRANAIARCGLYDCSPNRSAPLHETCVRTSFLGPLFSLFYAFYEKVQASHTVSLHSYQLEHAIILRSMLFEVDTQVGSSFSSTWPLCKTKAISSRPMTGLDRARAMKCCPAVQGQAWLAQVTTAC